MDDRMQRAKINAVSTLAHQLIATVCGMFIPWVMIDTFGSTAYGATTSIAQFLSYISLFEGGIGRVARGELYKPLALGNDEGISRVYLAVKRFFNTLGVAFLGYSLVLAFCYYDIADVTVFTREYIFALVMVISLGKFAEYMGGISNITLFNADQRQYVVNAVVIGSNIVNALLVVCLANAGFDILWVKLGSSLIFVAKPIIYTLYLKKHYRIVKTKERAELKNKWTGLAQHMAYVVQNNTDVLILTVFADLKLVAVYSVYHLISFSIRNITASFTGGMEAVFGNMIAKDEQDAMRTTYQKYKLLLTVLTIALFGAAIMLIVPFVKLYTAGATDADYTQPVFAVLLLLSDAINCLILPCFNLTIAANKLKESRIGAYGEAAVNLVLSCLLVFWNPLVGIAIGTLASALFKSVYYIVYSAKHILHIKTMRLFRDFAVSVLALLTVSVGGMTVIGYLPINNYFVWVLCGFGAIAVTGGVAVGIGSILYPGKMKGMILSLLKKRSS